MGRNKLSSNFKQNNPKFLSLLKSFEFNSQRFDKEFLRSPNDWEVRGGGGKRRKKISRKEAFQFKENSSGVRGWHLKTVIM